MRQRYCICIILLACLSACNRHDTYYRSVDPAAKAHIDWRPGSYWIMQDSASGALDSFYVVSYKEGTFYGSDERSNETISISIHESGLPSATDTTIWGVYIGDGGDPVNIKLDVLLKSQDKDALSDMYPFLPDFERDSFVVSGKSYYHVYLTNWGDVYPKPNYELAIGMQNIDGFVYIKLSVPNFNHTWFLVRNKIVHGS